MKQLANWRGARIASLVPNILPKAEAAACVEPRPCWCSCPPPDACGNLIRFCISCDGRIKQVGLCGAI
jgi:hypothetical protein